MEKENSSNLTHPKNSLHHRERIKMLSKILNCFNLDTSEEFIDSIFEDSLRFQFVGNSFQNFYTTRFASIVKKFNISEKIFKSLTTKIPSFCSLFHKGIKDSFPLQLDTITKEYCDMLFKMRNSPLYNKFHNRSFFSGENVIDEEHYSKIHLNHSKNKRKKITRIELYSKKHLEYPQNKDCQPFKTNCNFSKIRNTFKYLDKLQLNFIKRVYLVLNNFIEDKEKIYSILPLFYSSEKKESLLDIITKLSCIHTISRKDHIILDKMQSILNQLKENNPIIWEKLIEYFTS